MVKYKNNRLDDVFHALSDPTRREILKIVAKKDQRASDLAKLFQMSFPAVSKHIKVLEQAQLIRREVDGRIHRFYLRKEAMKKAYQWIKNYEQFWLGNLKNLDQFFKKQKGEKS